MMLEKQCSDQNGESCEKKIFHMQNGEIYEFNCSGR